MKKVCVCLLLAAALVFALERQGLVRARQQLFMLLEQGNGAQSPAPADPLFEAAQAPASDLLEVTLYYRFGRTGVLGMERAQLDVSREETIARSLVEALVAGPDGVHGMLTGLFPRGTQVIEVDTEGGTAHVTLSEAFLGKPDGAPTDWEDLTVWQEEAARRRYLAVQSIICTLTEGGRYQRVQLYVASSDDDAPRRIPLYYFDLSVQDPAVVLAASPRSESALLTPRRAMEMIFDGWQRRDWETVYALLCAPKEGPMPTYGEFEAMMREADVSLLTAEVSAGTVDVSGQTATLIVDGAVRAARGGDAQLICESVPLVRRSDNWAMRVDTLLSLMIRE